MKARCAGHIPSRVCGGACPATICPTRIASVLRHQDGRLAVVLGNNDNGQVGVGTIGGSQLDPARVGIAVDWSDVRVGEDHACAINTSGELWCWGTNDQGQLGLGARSIAEPTPTKVAGSWAAVGLGAMETFGLDVSGSLYGWGAGGASGDGTAWYDTPQELARP